MKYQYKAYISHSNIYMERWFLTSSASIRARVIEGWFGSANQYWRKSDA